MHVFCIHRKESEFGRESRIHYRAPLPGTGFRSATKDVTMATLLLFNSCAFSTSVAECVDVPTVGESRIKSLLGSIKVDTCGLDIGAP
jgi:hypothetical protein